MFIRRLIKNKKGQSVVELALLLPVLLIILMGIFEFGRIMNAYLIITHASREGARSASIGSENTQIVETINIASSTLDVSRLTVNVSPDKSSRKRGTAVIVNTGYDIELITPIISSVLPNPLHLEAETIMRVE